MKPSENCLNFIKNEEKCRLKPYLDSAGIPTIGWGSTMYPDGKKVTMDDPEISQTYADAVLKWAIDKKARAVDMATSSVKQLTQNKFDSLVSLTYNIGVGGFLTSTVLKKVKANPNDLTIADAFLMWNKITKNGVRVESKGLTARRKREIVLYFKVD